MSQITRYYNNGEENMVQWAQANLTPEEYIDFTNSLNENTQLWETYVLNGLITVTPVFESVYIDELDTNIDVQVGENIQLAPGVTKNDVPVAYSWGFWLARIPAEILTDELVYQSV